MSVLEIAREEASKLQLEPTDDELGFLIWECTSFPHFWNTDNPETEFREQIRTALSEPFSELAADAVNEYPVHTRNLREIATEHGVTLDTKPV